MLQKPGCNFIYNSYIHVKLLIPQANSRKARPEGLLMPLNFVVFGNTVFISGYYHVLFSRQLAFVLILLFSCYTLLTRLNQIETAVHACISAFSLCSIMPSRSLEVFYVVSALLILFALFFK